jgi:hypothetical protein
VLDKIEALPARRYAVIVDEAHSSQTGEAAADLRRALSARSEQEELDAAESEDAADEAKRGDGQDLLARSLAGRGRPGNLSFFAFTATPKAKTLELSGTSVETAEARRYRPFHLYSMWQAIDEGFILDVLANYTTYKTYFRIEKAITDDPDELEDIRESFRPWYERTEAVPTDPNLLYDTHRAMWDFGVLREDEVETGVQALLAVTETAGHGEVYGSRPLRRAAVRAALRRARPARADRSALIRSAGPRTRVAEPRSTVSVR